MSNSPRCHTTNQVVTAGQVQSNGVQSNDLHVIVTPYLLTGRTLRLKVYLWSPPAVYLKAHHYINDKPNNSFHRLPAACNKFLLLVTSPQLKTLGCTQPPYLKYSQLKVFQPCAGVSVCPTVLHCLAVPLLQRHVTTNWAQ